MNPTKTVKIVIFTARFLSFWLKNIVRGSSFHNFMFKVKWNLIGEDFNVRFSQNLQIWE